jgi:hypothetical protein
VIDKSIDDKSEQDLIVEEIPFGGLDVANSVMALFNVKVSSEIILIDIDKIEPDPNQPRKYFDQDSLNSLKDSIASSSLFEPIMIRKNIEKTEFYFIVDGERRWKACNILNAEKSGYDKIKCVILPIRINVVQIFIYEILKGTNARG